jgi:hypothetical protein
MMMAIGSVSVYNNAAGLCSWPDGGERKVVSDAGQNKIQCHADRPGSQAQQSLF